MNDHTNGRSESPATPKTTSRLRPSQRLISGPESPDRLKNFDRLIPPRKSPNISRESFLFSKLAWTKSRAGRVNKNRVWLTDPFEPISRRNIRSSAPTSTSQDQNLRQSQPIRSATPLIIRHRRHETSGTTHNRQESSRGIGTSRSFGTDGLSVQPRLLISYRQSQAPIHVSRFLRGSTTDEELGIYEGRLALALDIDPSGKILAKPGASYVPSVRSVPITPLCIQKGSNLVNASPYLTRKPIWRDNEWTRGDYCSILEAPHLRDDFYCSVLAYSSKLERLAVALGSKVYLWSESTGVTSTPAALDVLHSRNFHFTSVAFSSEDGGRAILATGRADGRVVLWSPLDEEPRYLKMRIERAVSHISFRPAPVRRQSQRHASLVAENEVLLIGDDHGDVYVYFVEWPDSQKRFLFGWHGSICLHMRVAVHTQQICGIAWSLSGDYFATGGNDNLCCVFRSSVILEGDQGGNSLAKSEWTDAQGSRHMDMIPQECTNRVLGHEGIRHAWKLNAAIKAIAFCPWQTGLLAAGGGSNDRCIHFFHTISGASIAAIDCAAQITALLWSTNRREIAATFGFAQPEHLYRIAVYAWPSCDQLIAIPWVNEMRALHAIGYPGRPNVGGRKQLEGSEWGSRATDEGCIVVAGSDGSIKFHEIWSEAKGATVPRRGLLGGSDILEGLHGIEKEGRETVR